MDQGVVDRLWSEHCVRLDRSIDVEQRRELFKQHRVRGWKQLYYHLQKSQRDKLASLEKRLQQQREKSEREKEAKRTVQISTHEPLTGARNRTLRRSVVRRSSLPSSSLSRGRGGSDRTMQSAYTYASGSGSSSGAGGRSLLQQLKSKAISRAPQSSLSAMQTRQARSSTSTAPQTSTLLKRQMLRSAPSPPPPSMATRPFAVSNTVHHAAPSLAAETRVIRKPVVVNQTSRTIDFTRRRPDNDLNDEEILFGKNPALSDREIFGKRAASESNSVTNKLRMRTAQEVSQRRRGEQVARQEAARYSNVSSASAGRSNYKLNHSPILNSRNGDHVASRASLDGRDRKRTLVQSNDIMRIPKKKEKKSG